MNRTVLGEHSLARATAVLVLSQLSFGFRSSFFNRSSMVILVTSQGSAARECLLAVGVRALVGSFTGMDAAMSGQRGRITEGLVEYRVSLYTNQAACWDTPFHIVHTCVASLRYAHGSVPLMPSAG